MALNLGIQTYQILTIDDEVCIPSLSSILLAVNFNWECVNFLGSASNLSPRRQMFQPKSLYVHKSFLWIRI